MNGDAKAALILTAADLIINKGIPALAEMVNSLSEKEKVRPVTIADIEAVKGELDSEKYFE